MAGVFGDSGVRVSDPFLLMVIRCRMDPFGMLLAKLVRCGPD